MKRYRDPVWVRVTHPPIDGDWRAAGLALAILIVICVLSALGAPG